MSVFPSWPWTNYNNYNLDWVIKKVKHIEEHLEEIVVDATSDILDDTLTNPDKAAQAKAAGDAIGVMQLTLHRWITRFRGSQTM